MQTAAVVDLPGEGTPICLVGGYGSGPTAYQLLIQALNACGNRVIWVPSLRQGGEHSREEHASFRSLALQAEHVLATLRTHGIDQAILLGHSMGGPVATILADLHPEMAVRIVYICSACLYPDKPWHLTWRMVKKLWTDLRRGRQLTGEEKERWRQIKSEAIGYVRANLRRAIAEGWTLGNFQVLSLLSRLQIPAFFIAGTKDPLFWAERQRDVLGHAFGDHFAAIDIHHDPQLWPEEIALLVATLRQHKLLCPREEP